MKRTAVLLYDGFCNFEIGVTLEILAMAEKPVDIYAKTLMPVRSEEGLTVLPEKRLDRLMPDAYDSLLLPGAMDIRCAVEDAEILSFVKRFDRPDTIIGAISIAPVLLLKNGVMGDRPFMAGINKAELIEEGFSPKQLQHMHDWDDNIKQPIEQGYIVADRIITSVSYEFVRFALGFAKLLGIEIPARTFGIRC